MRELESVFAKMRTILYVDFGAWRIAQSDS